MSRATYRHVRRLAGRGYRWLFPSPERAALRRLTRAAEDVARRVPGRIRLMDYDLAFADLPSVCAQWHEIFVQNSLAFSANSPAPRIIDCGANIGLASLYYKRLYPGARITAYEPDPALHAVLVDNLRRHNAADVEAVRAAAWTATGSARFRAVGTDSGGLEGLVPGVGGDVLEVPAIRLRDRLDQPVDLLKLDIEGAEGPVLEDCADRLQQVRAIQMEIHEFEPGARHTGRVLDVLAQAGFLCSLGDLQPLPWRPPVAAAGSPFAGRALCWVVLVRAWREKAQG